jgi:flagellin
MPQIINTNIASLTAQRNLDRSQGALETSLERLSSGLRINSAKDDAAGLAIANRFTSQIRGLNQAVRNANDGISVAQVAEGALGESTNILQRMRELAIQSANGTNGSSERSALQAEVSQLQSELTRIAETTRFGSNVLLNGSFGTTNFQVGSQANETIAVTIGDARASALGSNTLTADGTLTGSIATTEFGLNGVTGVADLALTTGAGTVTGITYLDEASAANIATAINAAAASIGITATASNSTTLGTLTTAGSVAFTLNGSAVSATVADVNDLSNLAAAINGVAGSTGVTASFANAADLSELTLSTSDGRDIGLDNITLAAGNISLGGTATADGTAGTNDLSSIGTVSLSSSQGPIATANANAEVFAAAGVNNSSFSSVGDISIATEDGAQSSLAVIDSAIGTIDALRADLGAVQNRLETTISNLQNVAENVSAARSRIQDADFAAETASLTRNSILQQAGISVLSQANALPQQVLALLQ